MMKKLLTGLVVALVLAAVVAPAAASAIATPPASLGGLPSSSQLPSTAGGLVQSIRTIANWVFVLIMVVVVFIVLWAAFQFLTSSGDPEAVSSARNKLLFAAVGIIVAMFAFVFPNIIQSFITG